MFCAQCGMQIEEDSTFCQNCGSRVEREPIENNVQKKSQEVSRQVVSNGIGNKSRMVGIIVAIVGIIIGLIFLMNGKVSVDLNKYVTITTEGYDTLGQAQYLFDYNSFYEDYKNKIKMKTQNGKSTMVQDWMGDSYFAVEMLNEYIGGSLDKTSKLSNGDNVTFSWYCEEDIIKELFNCNLKYSDITVQVSGLEEVKTFDPFLGIDIGFEGILPKVGVSVTNNSGDEKIDDIQFSPVINPTLKNGENIVIQATIKGTAEDFIEKYGMLPSPTEKQFKVEGLPEYIFSHNQMTAEHMDTLFGIAYDELVSESWGSTETVEEVQLIGSYIFSQKEPKYGDYEDYGSICTIFYVTVNCKIDTSEGMVDYPVNYYYCIKFDNILLNTDGSIASSNEFGAYSRPYNRFDVDTGYGSKYQYYYYGYQTLEEIKEDIIRSYYNLDDYNFEENKI